VNKVIVVTNSKGGPGKSTVSQLLALRLMQEGVNVVLLDLDHEQRTCFKRREQNGINVVLTPAEIPPCHVLVVDTPPRLSDANMRLACGLLGKEGDTRLVVPMQPTIVDLEATMELVHSPLLQSPELKKRCRLLFNCWSENSQLAGEREGVMKALGIVALESYLPRYQTYVSTVTRGWKAMVNPEARRHLDAVCAELMR